MRRRINRNLLGLVFVSILVMSVLISMLFYRAFSNRVFADLRETTYLAADILNGHDGTGAVGNGSTGNADNPATNDTDYESMVDVISFNGFDPEALRITIIAPDGLVLFDNQVLASTLENHSDRIEFINALRTGSGESTRQSATQLTETHYFAVLLKDGCVLRLSRTTNGISGIFVSLLPVIALVAVATLLMANYLASRLTKNIITPLEEINFDDEGIVPYDELAGFARRINEQRQENDRQMTALQNRSDTINTITNNMREGLILLDDSGKVMTANRSALAVFGATEHWAPDTDILHICRDFDFQQRVKACLQGESTEMNWQNNNSYYTIYFSPVLSADEIIGGVVLLFDITEQRRAEQLRREFSANVSHELKTPLTSISAISEMISTGMAKNEDIAGFATKISEQARRLVSIIDDIIKLSEFDEDMRLRDYTGFDLRELALVVMDALKALADENDVTISLDADSLPIVADRQMIDELLYNLLENAIKYNTQSGSVTVALSKQDKLVKIAVSDTGVGIAPEHQGRVFERFYRVDPSRSKQTGGSGLGLSIVKHIAEYHGGYVELESKVNQGTTISCYLPA